MKAKAIEQYIAKIEEPKRSDVKTLHALITKTLPAFEPAIYGSMIGYGKYHYRYESGREGDTAAAAFAPRKAATTVYLMDGVAAHASDLERLGPHTTGKGCLYLKDLSDVDIEVLEHILTSSYRTLTRGTHGLRARDGEE
jgi:hypothetical protein